MCVGRKRFTLVIFLLASLILPAGASAQSAQSGDWAALNSITTGSKLVVKLRDGKSVEGKLSGVSDAALSLNVKSKPVDLRREDVQSVYRIEGKSATKATLIGLGVGAGAGAAIGAAASSGDDNFGKFDQVATAGLTVVGAGVGALTGYLIGRGGKKRILVYEAR
jgi:small nuclear ribonucleoprotein (snRNP)-like protein